MSNAKLIDLNLKTILVNSFDFSDSDFDAVNATFAEQAKEVLKSFDSEFNYAQNKIRYPNTQERVAAWLQGLPSQCTVPFYNYDIIEQGKKALHLRQDASEKAEQTYLDNWFKVMANKLIVISNMKSTAEKSLINHIASKGR